MRKGNAERKSESEASRYNHSSMLAITPIIKHFALLMEKILGNNKSVFIKKVAIVSN